MKKKCNKCKRMKPIEDYYFNGLGDEGLHGSDGRLPTCKSCWIELKAKRKEEVKNEIKECTACGETKPHSQFYTNGLGDKGVWGSDGLKDQCILCWKKMKDEQEIAKSKEVKECTSCGRIKPYSQYYFNGLGDAGFRGSDGRKDQCISCWKEMQENAIKEKEAERRQCTECGETRPLDKFYGAPRDGMINRCIPCWDKLSGEGQ